jgi:hypothetical protein
LATQRDGVTAKRDRRRWIAIIAAVATLCGLGFLVAPSSQAASGPIFPVMNTSETPPDGVWFRNSPHTADTDRVTGQGVYAGDQVQLQCYAWGDPVGAYNNTLWYYASNLTRPTVPATGRSNVGFLNAHYINDGQAANVVDGGARGLPLRHYSVGLRGEHSRGHHLLRQRQSWRVRPLHLDHRRQR